MTITPANLENFICTHTQAKAATLDTHIQSLWSGYGSLDRFRVEGGSVASVIVKHVNPPSAAEHPRGWNTRVSHQRKLRSYRVESHWYTHQGQHCDAAWRIPQCYALEQHGDECLILLEDLHQAGFSHRLQQVDEAALQAGVRWLAHFHARFIGTSREGLWPQGSYWQLDARPDEWQAMPEGELKRQAAHIAERLKKAEFPTLIHGDAKLANFCFSADHQQVAAVDFQYVGGGCGMQDLAYFISKCFDEHASEQREAEILNNYFAELATAINHYQPALNPELVEAAWRPLFALARADYYRFLSGWSLGGPCGK